MATENEDDAAVRKIREQEFHENLFAHDDGDRPANRFYAVAVGVRDFYQGRVDRIQTGQRV